MKNISFTSQIAILTHLANAKKPVLNQTIMPLSRKHEKRVLADIICFCHVLDGVKSFSQWKEVTNTCEHMQHSPTIGRISSVQW